MFSNNNFHSIRGSLDLDLTCCDVIRGADASSRVVMTTLASAGSSLRDRLEIQQGICGSFLLCFVLYV